MCNEFAREKQLNDAIAAFESRKLPLFKWREGLIPNDLGPQPSIRIRDKALVVRLADGALEGAMTVWAWPSPKGAPVFNFRSEGRDFSHNDRVLVPATAFFEYTAPQAKGVKLKDKHRFEMAGEDWFWIAGVVKEGCFTLLTTEPGSDVAPYHNRQIVVLKPEEGLDWLTLARPERELLRPLPSGALSVVTVRKDGVEGAGQGTLF